MTPRPARFPDAETSARRAAMAALAHASATEIADGLAALPAPPECDDLRPVETGLVMLRGRIGGDGAAFNLGEATVTRATVRLATGEIGISYVLGRDHRKARLAAVCDALWQCTTFRSRIEQGVLDPIRRRVSADRARNRAQTAATKVDFFTLVRGED